MRILSFLSILILFLPNCRKSAVLSLSNKDQNKLIALQPLGIYDADIIQSLRHQLSTTFNTRVVILDERYIPEGFAYPYEEGYSADSLLQFLLQFRNDSIVEVVGLTHEKIHTAKGYKKITKGKASTIFYNHSIRGLAYLNQNVCIVSDFTLRSMDRRLWQVRVGKAVLHEVGHNIGLAHCDTNTCIMSETTGDIKTLDRISGNYCEKCRKK